MKERLFRFKQFSVAHELSAMKVGVDGVLLGAWAGLHGHRALDIGTGCGLIALMLAQREPLLQITAIDIDRLSCEEASGNFIKSPWSPRLKAINISFDEFVALSQGLEYDVIVSNPPFFDSGVETVTTARETARHQSSLTVASLMNGASELLSEDGRLTVIYPVESENSVVCAALNNGLSLTRVCKVRDHQEAPFKRVMLEFSKTKSAQCSVIREELTMFLPDKMPTKEYRHLCRDFYLKF